MALGLDRDDTVIRRRLRQKLEFVAEAAGIAAEPTDDQLRAFLEQRRDAYRTDARLSFVHVFLSAERRIAANEAYYQPLLGRYAVTIEGRDAGVIVDPSGAKSR